MRKRAGQGVCQQQPSRPRLHTQACQPPLGRVTKPEAPTCSGALVGPCAALSGCAAATTSPAAVAAWPSGSSAAASGAGAAATGGAATAADDGDGSAVAGAAGEAGLEGSWGEEMRASMSRKPPDRRRSCCPCCCCWWWWSAFGVRAGWLPTLAVGYCPCCWRFMLGRPAGSLPPLLLGDASAGTPGDSPDQSPSPAVGRGGDCGPAVVASGGSNAWEGTTASVEAGSCPADAADGAAPAAAGCAGAAADGLAFQADADGRSCLAAPCPSFKPPLLWPAAPLECAAGASSWLGGSGAPACRAAVAAAMRLRSAACCCCRDSRSASTKPCCVRKAPGADACFACGSEATAMRAHRLAK